MSSTGCPPIPPERHRVPAPCRDASIAFVRDLGADESELLLTDPQGAGVRRLSLPPGSRRVWGPAWSPNGRQLCCVGLAGDFSALFTVSADGLPFCRLTPPCRADEDSPAWSPDGARIAFVHSNRRGNDRLCELHLASGIVRPLTAGPGLDCQPSWSPDGRFIVFHRALTVPAGLYTLPVESGPARFLTPGRDPDWAPDNRRIAYSLGHLLWVIRVCEGGEVDGPPRPLTHDPRVEDRHPSWSPDGGYVVFSREVANGSVRPPHLVVLDIAGGDEFDLGEGCEPDWRPASLSADYP